MTGREKIMIALVLAAGCYSFMQFSSLSSSDKKASTGIDEIKEVDSSFNNLKDDIDLCRKQLVVNLLESKKFVDDNPFLTNRIDDIPKSEDSSKSLYRITADKFSYDGYFNVSTSEMAMINGDEYKEGDKLNDFPLAVKQIDPDWVQLVSDEGWSVKVFYSTKQ